MMAGFLRRLLGGGSPAPRLLEVGSPAPDFRVPAHDGSMVSLGDLRGRKVVLWFYPKADTPGCTTEGKGFCSAHADFEARGTTVLGISFDDCAANAAFAEKFGFPYQLLCDTGREIGMAYGACDSRDAKHARRITYVIDEHGTIRHALPKVDPATHTTEVLALLD
ncbi:MAG: peroxiredoxin [Candidatus Binatia bacterium]